jgi:VanZ family protein
MLSVSAELVQVLLPDRLPSLRDVVANASGAVIGAALAWLYTVSRRRGVHSHGPSDSPE